MLNVIGMKKPLILAICVAAIGMSSVPMSTVPGDFGSGTVSQIRSGSDELPLSTGLVAFRLKNGLSVLLYPRKDPTDSLEGRLIVRAGSLQEAENERGLAHFIEHMAFNGTKNFPGQSLFKGLEKHGIMLGADVNAVTSLGSTTYKLSFPKRSSAAEDAALEAFHEWAFNIAFDPKAFDREREIIVEEWRLRQGIGSRINNPLQSLRYRGSQSEFRDPIGLIDVIRTAPVERAKEFYRRWYQPQNMTLYFAGDFDVDDMREKIEKLFADVPAGQNTIAEDWGRFHAVQAKEDLTEIVLDPEQSDRFVQIMLQQQLDAPSNTVNTQWRDTLERLMLDILSHRFEIMKDNDLDVSLQTGESSWILSPSQTQVLLLARPEAGETFEKAVAVAAKEIKRMADVGPTEEELAEAKKRRLSKLEDQARNFAMYSNAVLANQAADAVTYRMPLIDKMQEYEMVRTFLASTTADHIRAVATVLLASTVKLAAVGPDDKLNRKTSVKSLREAWEKAAKAPASPFPYKEVHVQIDLQAPEVDANEGIVSEEKLPAPKEDAELRSYKLSNGMTVLVMSDASFKGNASFNLRIQGGYSATEDFGITRVPVALRMPMRCGIGKLKPADINRAAQDGRVSLMSYAEMLHHGLRGEAPLESLPTFFTLLRTRLNEPTFCAEALADASNRLVNDLRHSPVERRFMDVISREAFENGELLVATEKDVKALGTPQSMAELEAALLGNPEKMILTIVSSLPADEMMKKALPWLVTVKKRSDGVAGWRDQGIRPEFDPETKIYDWSQSPKTMIQMHYRAQSDWTQKKADLMRIVNPAANLVLRERLRTEISGVYAVGMNQLLSKEPSSYYLGRINFTTAPERAEAVLARAKEAVEQFAREGLSPAELRQAKKIEKVNVSRNSSDAYYWCEALSLTDGKVEEIQNLATEAERIDDLSLEEVNEFIRSILSGEPSVYMLVPKQQPLSESKN